jgi:hypothetical protein
MLSTTLRAQIQPDQINFVRQGAKRIIFDKDQSITLSSLSPEKIIGLPVMHPVTNQITTHAQVVIEENKLVVKSKDETNTAIWLGGFNPFATYTMDLAATLGDGSIGFEFTDAASLEKVIISEEFKDSLVTTVKFKFLKNNAIVVDQSIAVGEKAGRLVRGKIILQMLGSGLVLYNQSTEALPQVMGQFEFNKYIDLRNKTYLNSWQSHLWIGVKNGAAKINKAEVALTAGIGLADIRPITYETGEPMIDQGRLWYTMSIRGRGLPHPVQGVFSLNPSVFDIKLEGIVVFDRNDGLLRNEVASHIFYDRKAKMWRGVTTGFSAYANIAHEQKQLLIIESRHDPRFGFSVMNARPFQMVGDMEDPQILFDDKAGKWRMISCKNQGGYKAILSESDHWDKDYKQIAGPVTHNSTGTSMQRIGGKIFCFSGSSENKIYTYTYPDLKEAGTLKIDLPPWNETSGSRVWPNVVELPDGYSFKYVALMMDRFNYPGLQGQNWTYGALYLYHGYEPTTSRN